MIGIAGCGSDGSDGGDGGDGGGGGDGGDGGDGGGGDGGDGGDGGSPQQITYAIEATPSILDPHAVDTTSDIDLLCFPDNAYETLIYFPPDTFDTLEPRLASEVPTVDNGLVMEDGQVIEFPLREGVTFHDGNEMIADDVVFSWERAITMGLGPQSSQLEAFVDTIEAVDDYRVRLDLSRVYAPFITSIQTQPIAAIVSQQAVEDNGGVQAGQRNQWMTQNAAAGTGPYYGGRDVTDFSADDFLMWEAHEDYWREDLPNIPRIRQLATPEGSTIRALFERGEIEFSDIGAYQIDDFQNVPDTKFEFGNTFDTVDIRFNFDIPYGAEGMPENDTIDSDFFQDPNVRLGFAHAFDFDTYIEEVWNGYATRINQYSYPGQLGYDDSAPQYQTDLEQAEEYFRAAGVWEEGFSITAQFEQREDSEGAALILKDQFLQLNDRFEVTVQGIPEVQMVEKLGQDPWAFPFSLQGYLSLGPDPDSYYRDLYHEEGASASHSHSYEYINPEITEHIEAAAATLDTDTRVEHYHQLQRLCHEDPASVPLEAEERLLMTRECVDPAHNQAWVRDVMAYWNANC